MRTDAERVAHGPGKAKRQVGNSMDELGRPAQDGQHEAPVGGGRICTRIPERFEASKIEAGYRNALGNQFPRPTPPRNGFLQLPAELARERARQASLNLV
jgi:hypothetical protein